MDQPGNHILLRNNQPGAADRMRELLARTVQDHVADQQSNAGTLEDIRQRMESFAEQTLPRLHAVGDTVGQALDALRTQDERLTKLQHSLGKLQQSMETAAGRFSRLDKAVAELGQRTAHLDKEISAVKGRADAGFSTLAAKADQNAAATSGQVEQVLETMTATVDGLTGGVSGVSGQVEEVGGQLQLMHGRIERLDARLERLDERLDDQYDRVSAIDHTLASADTKLGALEGTMERVDGRLDGLDGRLEGAGARIDGLGEKFGVFDGKLETANGHFSEVSGKLADEFRSRPGPAEITDAVATIVDAAQQDVTAHLGSLEETVLTLAEALLRPPARVGGRVVPAAREGTRG